MHRADRLDSRHSTVSQRLMRVHWPVLVVAALIASAGIAALYSVAGGSFVPLAERHALRFILGVALVLAVAVVPLRFWLGIAYPAYVTALGLLALVLVVGIETMGARRWLGIAGLSFQPSEIMKVALVGALARYYQWLPAEKVSRPIWVLLPVLMIGAPVVLTLRQPDLGTAVLFAVVGLSIMFLAGVGILYFIGAVGCGGALAPFVWASLHDYQRRRLVTFLDPEHDPLGAGYHIHQSKIALGSGGLSGKGMLQGTQSHLSFLPEAHTDFAFTMFSEEMGFVGAVALLALYAILLLLLLSMAMSCRNHFSRLMASGVACIIFVYVFINVAMVIGLVPVVGVPLPLVSYGGTAMLTTMLAIGLAMCAFVNRGESIRRDDLGSLW